MQRGVVNFHHAFGAYAVEFTLQDIFGADQAESFSDFLHFFSLHFSFPVFDLVD